MIRTNKMDPVELPAFGEQIIAMIYWHVTDTLNTGEAIGDDTYMVLANGEYYPDNNSYVFTFEEGGRTSEVELPISGIDEGEEVDNDVFELRGDVRRKWKICVVDWVAIDVPVIRVTTAKDVML